MSATSFSKTVSALGWNTVGNLVATIGSFISLIVIARMLTPADFGLYLLALVTVAFLGLMTSALQQSIVQNQALETRHFNTIWTTSFFANGILLIALTLCVPWVAHIFNTPEVAPLLYACSVFLLLDVVINTCAAILWRNLAFKSMALSDFVSTMASIGVGITLAIWIQNPWALVGMEMTRRVTKVVILLYLARWRPVFRFKLEELRDVAAYSVNMTILDTLMRIQVVTIGYAISGFLGTAALGLYNLANRFLEQARQALVYPALSVSFPVLSKTQNDPGAFADAYRNCASLATCIGLPAYVGAIIVLPDLVPLLFADKWVPAIATMQVAMLTGCVMCFASVNGNVLRAIGRPDVLVRIHAFGFVTLLICLFFAVRGGIEYVMAAILVKQVVVVLLTSIAIPRYTSLSLFEQYKPSQGPVIAALMMFTCLIAAKSFLLADVAPVVRLLTLMGLGALTYFVSLVVFDKPLIGNVKVLLRGS